MTKTRNHVIYPENSTLLKALKQEYEWLGREVLVSENGKKLTILALPQKSVRKKVSKKRIDKGKGGDSQ